MLAALLCRSVAVAVSSDGGWPPFGGYPGVIYRVAPTAAQLRAQAERDRRKREDEEILIL